MVSKCPRLVVKAKKRPISKAAVPSADKPLERVHIDVVGPFPKSINGFVYACTYTDSNTRRKWIEFLKKKSDCHSAFVKWAANTEAKANLKISL